MFLHTTCSKKHAYTSPDTTKQQTLKPDFTEVTEEEVITEAPAEIKFNTHNK